MTGRHRECSRKLPSRTSNFHNQGINLSIKVECPECFSTYDVKDELVNRKMRCKVCAATIEVTPLDESHENPWDLTPSTEPDAPESAESEDELSSYPNESVLPPRKMKKKKKKKLAPPTDNSNTLGEAFGWTNPYIRYCLLAIAAKCVVIGLAFYVMSTLRPISASIAKQREIDAQFLRSVIQMFSLQIVILQAVLTIIWRIQPLQKLTGGFLFLALFQELWSLWLLFQMGAEPFAFTLTAMHGVLGGVAGYLLLSAGAEEHFWTSYNDPWQISERPDGMRAAILFQALLVVFSIPELVLLGGQFLSRSRFDELIFFGGSMLVFLFRLAMLFGYWRAFRWARLLGLWGIPLAFVPLTFVKLVVFIQDANDFFWLIPLAVAAVYLQFLIFFGLYQKESREHCMR